MEKFTQQSCLIISQWEGENDFQNLLTRYHTVGDTENWKLSIDRSIATNVW